MLILRILARPCQPRAGRAADRPPRRDCRMIARSTMSDPVLARHTALAFSGLCLALSAAVLAQQPRSRYDRYTDPIPLYTTGLGPFTGRFHRRTRKRRPFSTRASR